MKEKTQPSMYNVQPHYYISLNKWLFFESLFTIFCIILFRKFQYLNVVFFLSQFDIKRSKIFTPNNSIERKMISMLREIHRYNRLWFPANNDRQEIQIKTTVTCKMELFGHANSMDNIFFFILRTE